MVVSVDNLKEKSVFSLSIKGALVVFIGLLLIAASSIPTLISVQAPWAQVVIGILGLLLLSCPAGFFVLNPNEAAVLQFFGSYVGTVRQDGLRWTFPFYTKRKVSLRVRNFETTKLKVNDADGSPIEIAAVVVWRVENTAEACFSVIDVENFVRMQSESAVRNLAMEYPYDNHKNEAISLRGNVQSIMEKLVQEIQERLNIAGVKVLEARLSHLAYAPEIASNMLQRQQAAAVIAAREMIVEGAVGMVENALTSLSKRNLVHLDDERKAAMVSNLLVVLCGERAAQPVINSGTLYT